MTKKHAWAACTAAAALCALAASAAAMGDEETTVDQPVALDGLRVVRDKDTGKLRAPDENELKELLRAERAQGRRSGEEETRSVVIRQHADGMMSAELGPEFLVNVEAWRDEKGELHIRHDDPAHEHAVPVRALPTE